jgi:hypothetical protein
MIGLQGSTIWHEGQGTYSAIDFISTPGAKSNAGDLTLQPLLSISSRLHTGPDSVPRSSMGWLHSLFSPLRRMWIRAHSERRNRKFSAYYI